MVEESIHERFTDKELDHGTLNFVETFIANEKIKSQTFGEKAYIINASTWKE